MNASALKSKAQALNNEQLKLFTNGKKWIDNQAEYHRLGTQLDAVMSEHAAVKGLHELDMMAYGAEPAGDPFDPANRRGLKALAAAGLQIVGPPPLALDGPALKEMHDAVRHGKGYRAHVKELTTGSVGAPELTQVVSPALAFKREPTRILTLIPTAAATSPVIRYYVTTGTATAAAVAEGGLKPESSITYTPVDVEATKIAHRIRVTDEALVDIPAFVAVLQQDMVAGVIEAENAALLAATVVGAQTFPGLLNVTGIQTRVKGLDTVLDALEQALLDLRIGGSYIEPDGMVLHPTDWSRIRRVKDADGRYLVGVDPTVAATPQLWNVPVVVTTAMPVGTALVGAFADSAVAYIRDPLTLDTDRSGDDFDRNKTSIRAEERIILTVPRPAGLVKVTGLEAA